ncbi:hypothetical protein [Pseudoalteromonas peptidolytica]|uniref:hypothetical protein n=1 Tax=Pseudoalteromonas peptidolytica TaxID=61150 RepID=UPI00298EBD88|nr:hypothetical protein [Pseudoalteromonas peptidolytica]MDW7550147.1 hypothetical protein [Pseudoalteromonas peptidolytica]
MRVILTILVCATTSLVGCGGSASDSNTVPPPKNIAPNPAPNPLENKLNLSALDQQNSLYSSDLGYTTALERVFNLKNDKLLVLGETSSIEESGNKEGFYAITDPNGQTYQFEQSTEGFVDACVFDSGEYILGRFIQEGDDIFSVQLERYDETGVQLKSAPMQALSMDVKYDIPTDKNAWLLNPFTIIPTGDPLSDTKYTQTSITWWRFNNAKFTCHDENLYVSYNNGGRKIAKYDANLQLMWQKPIDIRYWGNSSRASEAIEIAVSDNGYLYSAQNISTDAIPAYNHKFSTVHAVPQDVAQSDMHVIVKTYDLNGELLNEQFISDEHSSLIDDIKVHQDTVFIGVSARRSKADSTRYSSEWDVGLIQVYHDERIPQRYWYNIDKEDVLRGLAIADNTLYLYGHIGGVQVDTNSWVEHTNGFIGQLDIENLSDLSIETYHTERSASIQSLSVHDTGTITAVGIENAPMTHSADTSMAGLFIKVNSNP